MIDLQKHRMQSCCCGCTVRTGSLILGILEVLGSVFQLVGQLIALSDPNYSESRGAIGGQIAAAIVSLIVGGCLVIGVCKDSKVYLLPWLVIKGIGICFIPIAMIIIVIVAIIQGIYLLLIAVLLLAFLGVLGIYFWRCVMSFYFDLQDQNKPKTIQSV